MLVGITILSGCVKEKQEEHLNFLTYEDSENGFKIKYPFEWTKKEGLAGSIASFHPTGDSNFAWGVFIRIENSSDTKNPKMTLNSYTARNQTGLSLGLLNINLIESTLITLANTPGHKIVYTMKIPNPESKKEINAKAMQLWTLKNKKGYIISYYAKPEDYPKNLELVQEMLKSFEILETKQNAETEEPTTSNSGELLPLEPLESEEEIPPQGKNPSTTPKMPNADEIQPLETDFPFPPQIDENLPDYSQITEQIQPLTSD